VAARESEGLRSIVSDAVALPGIASAAIFVLGPESGELELGAADGVTGAGVGAVVVPPQPLMKSPMTASAPRSRALP
jgi:hypothetical protein